ncbi:hypothetical protein ig2599ANME_2387 [groundwater metagenome]
MEKVEVEKFHPGVRVTHWLHGFLIIGFIVTGYGIYIGSYPFGDHAQYLALHMIMGFIWVMICLAHIYFMTVTGDRGSIWISMKDIMHIIKIAKNVLKLSEDYPEYGTYDVEKKKFYKKYHPVVKIKYWVDQLCICIAAISGFALYYVSVFNYINSYLSVIGLGINMIWFRWIHFMVFLWFFCVLLFHCYLSFIPVNRAILKSMIYGKEEVEVHK